MKIQRKAVLAGCEGVRGMTLNRRDTEYVSIGVSVASGCQRCLEVHVKEARVQGVSEEEIVRSMNIGLEVRERAQALMREHGLKLLGSRLAQLVTRTGKNGGGGEADAEPGTKIEELTALACAFAVNCETSLERHLANAGLAGATEEEIGGAIEISHFIKGKADSLCCKRI